MPAERVCVSVCLCAWIGTYCILCTPDWQSELDQKKTGLMCVFLIVWRIGRLPSSLWLLTKPLFTLLLFQLTQSTQSALSAYFFRRNCTLAGVSRGKCFFTLWKTKTKETTVYPVVKCIIVDSLRTDFAISQAFPSKLFLLDSFCHSDVLQLLHVGKSENCRFISFPPLW